MLESCLSAPLMVVAFSGPVLGERVSLRRWLAVGIGMLGVLVALRPSAAGFSLAGGLAALGYALTAITIRVMVRTETGAATALWGLLFPSLLSGVLLLDSWKPMRVDDWPTVLALGLTGSLGQHLITQAFRLAPAPLLAPLEYTALLWGIGFDALLWRAAPQPHLLLGAGIVVASGIYVLSHAGRAEASRSQARCVQLELASLLPALAGFGPRVPWKLLTRFGFVDDRAKRVVHARVDTTLAVPLQAAEELTSFGGHKLADRANPEHCQVAFHRWANVHERSQRCLLLRHTPALATARSVVLLISDTRGQAEHRS